MSFLKKIINFSVAHENTDLDSKIRHASIDVTDEENSDVYEELIAENNEADREAASQFVSKPSLSEHRKRKCAMSNEVVAKIIKFIDHQMNAPKEQENRHTAFFKSIFPTLSLLNDDQVLEFQAGVINVLQNIKSKACTAVNTPTSQQH